MFLILRESWLRVATPLEWGIFETMPKTQLKATQTFWNLYFLDCLDHHLKLSQKVPTCKTLHSASKRLQGFANISIFFPLTNPSGKSVNLLQLCAVWNVNHWFRLSTAGLEKSRLDACQYKCTNYRWWIWWRW